MPNFPNINTLTEKTSITGNEVIQISATEKAKLSTIVRQLSQAAVLTGFTTITPGVVGNQIKNTDTLMSAFKKLMARAGNSNEVVFAHKGAILVYSKVANSGDIVVLFGPTNRYEDSDPNIYLWYNYKSGGFTTESETTEEALYEFALAGVKQGLTTVDTFSTKTTSSYVYIKPGDCIFETNNDFALTIDSSKWGNSASNSAMIVCNGSVKHTSITSPVSSDVLHFSEGFDDVISDDYVAITIQLMMHNNTKHYFINQCSYTSS